MIWLVLLAAVVGLVMLASAVALWSYGRFARQARGRPSYRMSRDGRPSALDRHLDPLEAAHPGRSAAATLFDNRDAFAARLESVRRAERSVDMLYYIWTDDLTGNLLAAALIEAADRGVRVRLLLDDVNVLGFDPNYLDMNGHPRIEMRVFNPIRNRRNAILRGIEMMLAMVRYNRRMHTKAFIVDGRLAIVGGRNIGDTYFEAARRRKKNSLDADLLIAGPVVGQTERMFDAFWNSKMALPVAALWQDHVVELNRYRRRLAALRRHRRGADYLARLPEPGVLPGLDRLRWCESIRLITDPPLKALGDGREDWIPFEVSRVMRAATAEVKMITPYFVPGNEGMAELTSLTERGISLEILTNSLSSTDQIVVHGAYRRYRHALLAAGVKLFEYGPRTGRGRMLHGKTILVDRRLGFVGSYNYDLRSAFLNTEAGILFEDAGLAAELDAFFAEATAPENAYAVSAQGRWIRWDIPGDAEARPLWYEPEAGTTRRGVSWLVGHLPIHSYL